MFKFASLRVSRLVDRGPAAGGVSGSRIIRVIAGRPGRGALPGRGGCYAAAGNGLGCGLLFAAGAGADGLEEQNRQASSGECVDAEPEVGVLGGFAESGGDHRQGRSLQPVRHLQVAGVQRAQGEPVDER